MLNQNQPHFMAALKIRDVRYFIGSTAFFTLASRALTVVIGFQIYKLTHSALALGYLGLIEAIPAISLVLFGGYVADHFDRRKILLLTRAASCICTLALVLLSLESHHQVSIIGLYTVIFLAGVARGFADPAGTAFESQIIPRKLTVSGGSWISSTWISCAVLGPAAIGFIFDAWDAAGSYAVITLLMILSWFCMTAIPPKPQTPQKKEDNFWKSIGGGLHFVLHNQPLWGALALDLFAVLFGGAIALLPIYANDILHVGAKGLGLLNAAPYVGTLLITLLATRKQPIARAGRNLLWTVFGFGMSMIIFAFSKNFWLSMTALFFSGVFDGISVVIRRSMIRLLSPEHLRGRVAATSWIFICASNELGAFESGMMAAWIGAVPCVALGGLVTLGIVAATTALAPQLRNLRFNPNTLAQEPSYFPEEGKGVLP